MALVVQKWTFGRRTARLQHTQHILAASMDRSAARMRKTVGRAASATSLAVT